MADWRGLSAALNNIPVLDGARCAGKPELFDDAAPGEPNEYVILRHQQALGHCRICPALDACREWFTALPRWHQPPGVIAGIVHHHPETKNPRKATA